MSELTQITIFVKGACVKNPGTGGYAAVLISGERREEIAGARKLTTNNRMELLATIAGLEALKWSPRVTIRSDSRYLVDGGNERQKRRPQVNRDLWDRLRDSCEKHEVVFEWVGGNARDPEVECCRRLAQAEARREELPEDTGYGTKPAGDPKQLLLFD